MFFFFFFLELSCFFYDPADVGNFISCSSAFSKASLNIRKFTVHVLLIISEGLTADFEKKKSKKSPKSFSKENVVCNRTRYDNSTAFYREYYGGRIDLLVNTIKRYKQLKGKHQKDELYLADLLK